MEEFFQAVLEFISVLSGFVGALSLLLAVLFVWRYGAAIGAGVRRMVDAALLINFFRNRGQSPLALRLLEMALVDRAEFDPDLPLLITGGNASRGNEGRRARPRPGATCNEGYALAYFARKHGLSRNEADRIIKRIGSDREKLNRAGVRAKQKRA